MKANIYKLDAKKKISDTTPIVVIFEDTHKEGTGYAGFIKCAKEAVKSSLPKDCAGYFVSIVDEINGMHFANWEKMYKK